MPCVASAKLTDDYRRTLERRSGRGRPSTIRKRVRSWRRFSGKWLRRRGILQLPTLPQLLDVLDDLVEANPTARTIVDEVVGTLAYLENAGGVPWSERLAASGSLRDHVAALNQENDSLRESPDSLKAIQLHALTLVAWESFSGKVI